MRLRWIVAAATVAVLVVGNVAKADDVAKVESQAPPSSLTVQASSEVPATSRTDSQGQQPQYVYVWLRGQASDISGAGDAYRAVLAKVKTALGAAGIPMDAISELNLQTGTTQYMPYMSGPGMSPPPAPMPEITGSLQVKVTRADQVLTVLVEATKAGATSVGTTPNAPGEFISLNPSMQPTAQPTPDALSNAIQQATETAKELAAAQAQAAGVTLGHIVSIKTSAPDTSVGMPGALWRVTVSITYSIN